MNNMMIENEIPSKRLAMCYVMTYNVEWLLNILTLVRALSLFATSFLRFFRFLKFLLLFPSNLSSCLCSFRRATRGSGIGQRYWVSNSRQNGQSGETRRREERRAVSSLDSRK